jgi:cation-transporting ATPase E
MNGLSTQEVLERRARGLGNRDPVRTSRSYFQIICENVFTFVNMVLFGLGTALVLLGRPSDAIVSVLVILINVIVSVFQEIRAKRTLDRIALLTRPKATVLRDGQEQAVDPDEIVLGDILVLRLGDQVVVDGQVVGEAASVSPAVSCTRRRRWGSTAWPASSLPAHAPSAAY